MEASPENERLYIKIKCSVCFGTRSNRNGGGCLCCDAVGTTYIEASFSHLKTQLQKLPKEDKIEVIELLSLNNAK